VVPAFAVDASLAPIPSIIFGAEALPPFWISARGLGLSGTSTHLTRQLSGTNCGPLRHPSAPGLSPHGRPVDNPGSGIGPCPCAFVYLFNMCVAATTSVSSWAYSSIVSPSRVRIPRKGRRVGLNIDLFGHARVKSPLRHAHSSGPPIRGPDYPKASDISSPPCLLRLLRWSNRRVGLAPHCESAACPAHPLSSH